MGEPPCNLAGGHRPATEVNRQKDLSPRRMGQRGENILEYRELCFGVKLCDQSESGSTSVSCMFSRIGPMGSQMAITSGDWWAISEASPFFH